MNDYHYALVVGISGYPGLDDLNAPVNDAHAFREWLVGPGQVPSGNITCLVTDGPKPSSVFDARPIKREFDIALSYLHDKADDDLGESLDRWAASRLYIYVAGHGIMPRDGQTALLLADAQEGLYENVELSDYLDWYRFCGIYQEVVVFADCCRNWFGNVKPSRVPFTWKGQPQGRVFYLAGWACGPADPAFEQTEQHIPPDERRGYFTRALLDGLAGAAPVDNAKGAITSTTLAGYVSRAVAAATSNLSVPQAVEMPLDGANPICFGPPTQVVTYDVNIHLPEGWHDPVELLMPGGERTAWNNGPNPWNRRLCAGIHAVLRPGTLDGTAFENGGMFMVTGDRDVHL